MPSGTAPRRRTSTSQECDGGARAVTVPSRQIARRAFEIFLSRGGSHGHDMDDWLKAELEVNARAARES
jgi:hypothetical protein